jgi:hypothetical protein
MGITTTAPSPVNFGVARSEVDHVKQLSCLPPELHFPRN